MIYGFSNELSKGDMDKLHSLEQELGKTILAFSCTESEPAEMSEDGMKKIKELEEKMGVSLVAV